MKIFRHISVAFWVALVSSCSFEDWNQMEADSMIREQDSSQAVISISKANLVPVNVTKAESQNLNDIMSKIVDLNILVLSNDGTYRNIYCNSTSLKVDEVEVDKVKPNVSYIGGFDLASLDKNGKLQLHIDDMTSSQIVQVEAIANAGRDLTNEDWDTVQEEGKFYPYKDQCMMYGIAKGSSGVSDPAHDGKVCAYYDIELKRSRAMVTVKLINDGLNPGVVIKPTKIRYCNVPASCNMRKLGTAEGNKITDADPVLLEEKLVSIGSIGGGGMQQVGKENEHLGEHLDVKPLRLDYIFCPFENKQGVHPNGSGKDCNKYPTGITTVAEAKNPKLNHNYSYFEIEAEYLYRENGLVKIGGTLVYRFFLGGNAADNFDLIGNHYYKIDLHLKGFGGAKEDGKVEGDGENAHLVVNDKDLSWRVDMKATEWGFQKDQYDFDGHLVDGLVPVVGDNWRLSKVVVGDEYSSWLTLNISEHLGQTWANPTTIVRDNCKLNIVNGCIRFAVEPMIYMKNGILDPSGQFDENTYKQPVNYREMKIEVERLDAHNHPMVPPQLDYIVVRQYAPIPVTLNGETFYMERFEEYPMNPDGNLAYGFPWKYQGDNLSNLKNLNGSKVTYHYGEVTKDLVGRNTTYLLKETNSAAFSCYAKGQKPPLQGNEAKYYALPSVEMMKAMFERCKEYDPSWGPFEPMHMYEKYWTSTVNQETPAETVAYDGLAATKYASTPNREALKKTRTIYTNQNF